MFTPEFIYCPKEHHRWTGNARIKSWFPNEISMSGPGVTVLDSAIYFFHFTHWGYFHMIAETMPLLFCMDRQIIRSSTLLTGKYLLWNIFYELLDILDMKPKRIVQMNGGSYFAWTLHITTPWILCQAIPSALRPMQQYILKKDVNLSNILPHRRVFLQRKKHSPRCVCNEKELMKGLSVFKNPSFEMVFGNGSLLSQIRLFRSVMCLFAVRGSGSTNAMWMLPNTVFIEIQSRHCDSAFARLANLCGLQVFEFTHPFINTWSPNWLNIETVVKVIGKVFVLLKWEVPD
jgi:capsular polysaccharide biosynthesis protein